jgi:large subunit ribosomal protein L13
VTFILVITLTILLRMNTLSYKTKSANAATVDKKWVVVDAEGEVLGRLAAKVAYILRGKHKPDFTPHVDCGDNVIVINAEKIVVTGKKAEDKKYIRHTGYPGGQRVRSFNELMKKKPTAAVEHAIKGMLPKNRLGRELFRNLFVFEGPEHKHQAQKPIKLELNEIK